MYLSRCRRLPRARWVHELRLHPYLFPVGLGGLPTFMEGGDPAEDAKKYWINIRRALLRSPVERIGLGGYLHLTEKFPDYNADTECAYYPESGKLAIVNNSGKKQQATVNTEKGIKKFLLMPYEVRQEAL